MAIPVPKVAIELTSSPKLGLRAARAQASSPAGNEDHRARILYSVTSVHWSALAAALLPFGDPPLDIDRMYRDIRGGQVSEEGGWLLLRERTRATAHSRNALVRPPGGLNFATPSCRSDFQSILDFNDFILSTRTRMRLQRWQARGCGDQRFFMQPATAPGQPWHRGLRTHVCG